MFGGGFEDEVRGFCKGVLQYALTCVIKIFVGDPEGSPTFILAVKCQE